MLLASNKNKKQVVKVVRMDVSCYWLSGWMQAAPRWQVCASAIKGTVAGDITGVRGGKCKSIGFHLRNTSCWFSFFYSAVILYVICLKQFSATLHKL